VTILVYLLVPLLIVLAASLVMWMRNRQPTSLQSGVDDFRREMQALSPETLRAQGQRPPERQPPAERQRPAESQRPAARPQADQPLDRSPRSPRSSAPSDEGRRAESG
jgi:hypothetical protein